MTQNQRKKWSSLVLDSCRSISLIWFNIFQIRNDLSTCRHLTPLQSSQQHLHWIVLSKARWIYGHHLNNTNAWNIVLRWRSDQHLIVLKVFKNSASPYAVHYITAKQMALLYLLKIQTIYLYLKRSYDLLGGSSVLTNNLVVDLENENICLGKPDYMLSIKPRSFFKQHTTSLFYQRLHLWQKKSFTKIVQPRRFQKLSTLSLSLTSPIRKIIGRPSGRTKRSSFI